MKSERALKQSLCQALSLPPKLTVSSWADKFSMLPSDSAEPGLYKTSRVPYMRAVMDAFNESDVHKIVVKSSSQIGKSAVILNIVGYTAHLDPANIMLIQPTLDAAMDFSKSRLSKLIADCRVLTPLFYEKLKTRDSNQTILSKVFKGGRIILVGANSPAGLASRPIRILLCDEVDRYPPSASGEGDPISLAQVRCSTYWNYKMALFSTPTVKGSSRIDVEYELGTQEVWSHECPNCHSWEELTYQQMISEHVKVGDAVLVKWARWRCPQCGFEFTQQQMRSSNQKYIVHNPDALKNGVRSFFISGFASPWLKWEDIMREWLEAQGDPMREAVVMNTRFGLSYEKPGEVDDKELPNQQEDYGADLPEGVLLLTAGVDVQKNRLEYGVYGWDDKECWGIKSDVIRGEPHNPSTWQDLYAALSRIYHFKDGTPLKVARTFIDSGYATDYVYGFCRVNARAGFFAIKGKSIFGAPFLYKTGRLKESGIYLTILNVDEGKNEVYSLLSSGKVHFGRDHSFRRNFDETFFRQLTAEHRVRKTTGRESWELISRERRNEALDIFVYARAAMLSCINGEHFWEEQEAALRGQIKKPVARQALRSRTLEVY